MPEKPEITVMFDEYQRYGLLSRAIEFYRNITGREKFNILEIGANDSKHLRQFLPNDSILYTDIKLTEAMRADPEFDMADGTDLQYETGSFDFVIATDVLEHVPQELRGRMLSEANRVSSIGSIFTFPHYSEDVLNAEKRVNQYYKAINGEDYIWLKEHAKNVLPKTDEVNAILDDLDCEYLCRMWGNLELWERLYYSLFSAAALPITWDYHRQIDSYYIKELYAGDTNGSCYRAIYIIVHGEIAPLRRFLDGGFVQTPREKLDYLDVLLSAQRQIEPRRAIIGLQKETVEKQARIDYLELREKTLESENKDIRSCWSRDVKLWESDVDKWKRDVDQWKIDSAALVRERESHQANIEQWNADLAKLENIIKERDALKVQNDCWTAKQAEWAKDREALINEAETLRKTVTENQAEKEKWEIDRAEWKKKEEMLLSDRRESAERLDHLSVQLSEIENGLRASLADAENRLLIAEQHVKEVEQTADALRLELNSRTQEISQERRKMSDEAMSLRQNIAELDKAYREISNAFFWKLTLPLRKIVDFLKKAFTPSKERS